MSAPDYVKQSEAISKRLGQIGLEETGVILAEGFCPLCSQRGSVGARVCDISEERPGTSSKVECIACLISWRAGVNRDNGRDWIEHTVRIDKADLVATFSMCINAPSEPREDHDDWFDDEDYSDTDDNTDALPA